MRRKGVGKALATRLLEEAKAMRVERIDLEVTPTNAAAAAFWKSMGFRTGGRTVYGRGIVQRPGAAIRWGRDASCPNSLPHSGPPTRGRGRSRSLGLNAP